MALQQFFFEELRKGSDPNGAAAQALLRLNELAAGEKERAAKPLSADLGPVAPEKKPEPQVVVPFSPPRPPTPMMDGGRRRRPIRVSQG